jgi:hypothetical protein
VCTFRDKADQLERWFGVRHPLAALYTGLRRKDDRDIEPYLVQVARDRLTELSARGFGPVDAAIVLLMRGARREVLCRAVGIDLVKFCDQVKIRMVRVDLDPLIGESQVGLDLMRRA